MLPELERPSAVNHIMCLLTCRLCVGCRAWALASISTVQPDSLALPEPGSPPELVASPSVHPQQGMAVHSLCYMILSAEHGSAEPRTMRKR